jgi:hypothetical protein
LLYLRNFPQLQASNRRSASERDGLFPPGP